MGTFVESDRSELKKAYPWPNWHERVDKMSDKQVEAVLAKFRNEGKIK